MVAAACAWCVCSRGCRTRSKEARVLRPSDRGPSLLLAEDVVLPHDIEIGANVVIHSGVELGAGVRIQDAAVLGKALVLSNPSSGQLREPDPTIVGDRATIAAQAVVVAG